MGAVALYGYFKMLVGVTFGRAASEVDLPSVQSVATFSVKFTISQLYATTPHELLTSMTEAGRYEDAVQVELLLMRRFANARQPFAGSTQVQSRH